MWETLAPGLIGVGGAAVGGLGTMLSNHLLARSEVHKQKNELAHDLRKSLRENLLDNIIDYIENYLHVVTSRAAELDAIAIGVKGSKEALAKAQQQISRLDDRRENLDDETSRLARIVDGHKFLIDHLESQREPRYDDLIDAQDALEKKAVRIKIVAPADVASIMEAISARIENAIQGYDVERGIDAETLSSLRSLQNDLITTVRKWVHDN